MRVLALDDDPQILECFESLLSDRGYTVQCVDNAQEALKIVRGGGVQIVLCDQLLPQMSGLDFCRAIRKERLPSYIYCIMISGKSTQEDRLEALAAGADDFLAKPFDARELLHRVRIGARLMSMALQEITVFHPGEISRVARPRNRRASGARQKLLPAAGAGIIASGKISRSHQRRIHRADFPNQPAARHR
jgi:DNA-binding response OmpR family regulator